MPYVSGRFRLVPFVQLDAAARAGTIFNVAFEHAEAKYTGHRTDASHAVNGSVPSRGETFQCSFGKKGYRIIQFALNDPS